ncbi:hypothetical protein K1719_030847 [Acacia pycnantha]|nr:hypothetical protein K1719_030847 [Acacia pycnantha]
MRRKSQTSVILHGNKLLQQFIVDGYSMVESDRLDYIRKHQKELRVDLYSGITDALTRGETDPSSTGRRVILPSYFTGGARYMIQNYQDAMAICAWADVYTVEFQKRRLPHAHIILWLSESNKIRSSFEVDQLISAEIPDKLEDPELYELVGSYMVHGPCGRSSRSAPCMKDCKCSKYFPKRFCARTMLDEHGYPTYRRRDDGHMVSRKGVKLDNRSVVPYNATLLKLFGGHLNIEKTNQSRAIKYLFKYISKGNDRVIAGIYNKNDQPGSQQSFDEISHYLNCRYVSSCEASWRIFGFDIHHRHPPWRD